MPCFPTVIIVVASVDNICVYIMHIMCILERELYLCICILIPRPLKISIGGGRMRHAFVVVCILASTRVYYVSRCMLCTSYP